MNVEEKLNRIREEAYIELYYWSRPNPDYDKGIIITADNDMYRYNINRHNLEDVSNKLEKEENKISDEIRKTLDKYINKKIKGKKIKPYSVFDRGWTIKIYAPYDILITNRSEYYDDIIDIINNKYKEKSFFSLLRK